MKSSPKKPRYGIPFVHFATALFTGVVITGAVFNSLSSQSTSGDTNLSNTGIKVASLPLKPAARPDFQAGKFLQDPLPKPVPDALTVTGSLKGGNRTTVVVEKGDNLSSIFSKLDIYSELAQILESGKDARQLKKIYPGQKLHFTLTGKRIDALEFERNLTSSLVFHRDGNSFTVEELNRKLDGISQVASGRINSSLFLAGQKAGMSDALIMDLAHIFRWDIDFALDIREGDSFTVLYEKLHLNGEEVDDGNITAAEFTNNGNTYRAYRYTDRNNKTEYYTSAGKSVRKSFLRTPVDLARISSSFNLRRRHPILNKIRAHKGVDYAAASGTPIMASGTGKVIYRGTKGGYGKMVILRHGNIYTTLYAHMSRYARGTSVGSLVKQGQTIGYIGSTGLATGPHLHYEFRINGVHRNPLKVKLPGTKPLPDLGTGSLPGRDPAPGRAT